VIPNIGPRGQRSRYRFGIVVFGAAAVPAVVLFPIVAVAITTISVII